MSGAPPPIVVFANLKGGSGKTTSAAFTAHALHDLGLRVLAVDADPLAVLTDWAELAQHWPFPVRELASKTLHKDLPGMIRNRADAVVIDTPGNVTHREIIVSAMRVATHIVIPLGASRLEEMLLPDVVKLYQEAGSRAPAILLLNRVHLQSNSLSAFRDHYSAHYREYGFEVCRSVVPNRQMFITAAGMNIRNASGTAYGDLARQVTGFDQKYPQFSSN